MEAGEGDSSHNSAKHVSVVDISPEQTEKRSLTPFYDQIVGVEEEKVAICDKIESNSNEGTKPKSGKGKRSGKRAKESVEDKESKKEAHALRLKETSSKISKKSTQAKKRKSTKADSKAQST
jgi:hypothetical protein